MHKFDLPWLANQYPSADGASGSARGWSFPRHCEERSDEAIHIELRGAMDCFAALAMTAERVPRFRRRATASAVVRRAKGRKRRRSILGDGGAAKRVVHADRDQVEVLTDAIDDHRAAGSRRTCENTRRSQAEVSASHEEMVVFDGDRPAREKAIFKTGADRSAGPGVAHGSGDETRCGDDIVVAGGGYRKPALHIKQRIAPGITDLSGEKPERIDPRAIGDVTGNGKENCIAHLGAAQA